MNRSGRQAKSPAFQWYVVDFRGDRKTQRLSCLETGAFHLLLDEQWIEGPLPDDLDALAAICLVDRNTFDSFWPRLEPSFPLTEHGRRASRRLERERALQAKNKAERQARMEKLNASRARKKAARARRSTRQRDDDRTNVDSSSPRDETYSSPQSSVPSPHTPGPACVSAPRAERTDPHGRVIQAYTDAFERTHSVKYPFRSRDGADAKRLLETAGTPEAAIHAIETAFSDQWRVDKGITLAKISAAYPELLAMAHPRLPGMAPAKYEPPTPGFLAEARMVIARGAPDPKDVAGCAQHSAILAGLKKHGLTPESVLAGGRVAS